MRGHRDLELVVLGAALSALIALLVPLEELRLIGALPLTLVLPGYAIVALTFARRPLGWPHLFVLSLGISLMVLTLGALVLNYGPGGIQSVTWAILLFVVVLAASRGAALRRPPAARRPSAIQDRRPGRRPRPSRVQGVMIAATPTGSRIMTALPPITSRVSAKSAFAARLP